MRRIVKNAVIGKRKRTVTILCGVCLGVVFAVGGCKKLNRIDLDGVVDAIKQSNCDKDVIVSTTEYENAPNDFVDIIDVKIVNNCLKIKFCASGCDGSTWKVELIDAEGFAKSNPIQRYVRLSLDNKEDCYAVITKELSFNIENLRCPYGGKKVVLHIYGSNTDIAVKTILYEY